MLNLLTIDILNQSEPLRFFLAVLILFIGAAIAGFTWKSKLAISRAPFFALSTLTILVQRLFGGIWLLTDHALNGGYIWLLMLVNVVVTLVAGYILCVLAIARSRDAFGKARYAFLAFIPLIFFILIFKSSKQNHSENRMESPRLFTGGLGALTGLVFFVAGIVSTTVIRLNYLEIQEGWYAKAQTLADNTLNDIDRRGLEETLKSMAAQTQVPATVDSITTLVKVEAHRQLLKRYMEVSFSGLIINDGFRTAIHQHICAHPLMIGLYQAGAETVDIYQTQDGEILGKVITNKSVCKL